MMGMVRKSFDFGQAMQFTWMVHRGLRGMAYLRSCQPPAPAGWRTGHVLEKMRLALRILHMRCGKDGCLGSGSIST